MKPINVRLFDVESATLLEVQKANKSCVELLVLLIQQIRRE